MCVCFSEAGSRYGAVPAPPLRPLPAAPRPLLPLYQRERHPRPTAGPHRPQGGAHGETPSSSSSSSVFWKSRIFTKSEKKNEQPGPSCRSCFPSALLALNIRQILTRASVLSPCTLLYCLRARSDHSRSSRRHPVLCSQLAPENTLMSFEKAVDAGSEGLETDVAVRSVSQNVHT